MDSLIDEENAREGRLQADMLSLLKGLRIVELINESPGMNVKEITARASLARTTTYRTLCTLERNGFVYRESSSARYFPNARVLRLSHGFDALAALTAEAREALESAQPEVRWPMHLASPHEQAGAPCMRILASTDHGNPLAIEKMLPGQSIPVLQCAAGLAWVAFLAPAERQRVIDAALREQGDRSDQTRWDAAAIDEQVARIRGCGFARYRRPGRYTSLVGLSVPVTSGGQIVGALTVRFAETAVPLRDAIARFLPPLRSIADRLG